MTNSPQPIDPEIKISEPISITAREFAPSSTTGTGFRIRPWQILLIMLAALGAAFMWFLFTSKSVQLIFTPDADTVVVSGGFSIELGGVWLLREGRYNIQATSLLHEPLEADIQVGSERNQQHRAEFTPLPGSLKIITTPIDASVMVDGEPRTSPVQLSAGPHTVQVTHPRYQPSQLEVAIEGKRKTQQVELSLTPNWAEVTVTSEPAGATVLIDGDRWPDPTPTTVEALAGERLIELQLDGYKRHAQRLFAKAEDRVTLPDTTLIQADAQVRVESVPSGAGVIVGGQYRGRTPLLVDLKSGARHPLQVVRAGFADYEETLRLARGEIVSRNVTLQRLTGTVQVTVEPTHAEIYIDGQRQSSGAQSFTLPIRPHDFRVTLEGHAPFSSTVTPKNGLLQELRVKLLTTEEARIAALIPSVTTPNGETLKLFSPYPFSMGASRREPGRRANETLREVSMSRLFYLATHETTNAQFRKFASGHDSGKYVEATLNEDDQPATNLSWHDAAAYCNWLSEQQGLTPFYELEFGKVVGSRQSAKGYRLPSEAEWGWAARTLDPDEEQLKFPWGANLPPPERHGNYADRSAGNLVGRIIFGYNDNYAAAAPTGSYKPNHRGLFDMGGNVAEWTNDYYEIPGADPVSDPRGPNSGEYHVIKGASWMHGTVTELRYSFRDYGIDGRQDVGFRVARSAE